MFDVIRTSNLTDTQMYPACRNVESNDWLYFSAWHFESVLRTRSLRGNYAWANQMGGRFSAQAEIQREKRQPAYVFPSMEDNRGDMNGQQCCEEIIRKFILNFVCTNQHIRMISEGSCDKAGVMMLKIQLWSQQSIEKQLLRGSLCFQLSVLVSSKRLHHIHVTWFDWFLCRKGNSTALQ